MVDPCPVIHQPWWKWYPYVGFFIAILAGLGVIVPWFSGERLKQRWKIIWSLAFVLLVILELHSIKLDGEQHDRDEAHAQCEQLKGFEKIAKGIEDSNKKSADQFAATIQHVDGVLKTTQSIAALAQEDLNNVTGGKSFGYVVPSVSFALNSTFIPPETPIDTAWFSMHLKNDGNEVLSGVSVAVARIIGNQGGSENIDSSIMNPVTIGTLAPRSDMLVPTLRFSPDRRSGYVDPEGFVEYIVSVTAQNGAIYEKLWFRPSAQVNGWDYKLVVWRNPHRKNDPPLKAVDWTSPIKRR